MATKSLEGVKLSQIRILIAVAQYQNFSEAALHLQISQSAVSHAIATLENELGVVLFSRGRHGAILTPVGERILAHAQVMLNALDDMGRDANRAKGLDGGEVRVASFRSVATHILPRAIAIFRQRHPGILITITEHSQYGSIEQYLREGKADVGIVGLPAAAGLDTWELLHDEYLALLPPNTEPNHETLTWETLLSYPLILAPETDPCCSIVRHHFTNHGYTLDVAHHFSEDSTMISMVMQGLGAAILPQLAATPLPEEIRAFSLPVPLERIIGVAISATTFHPPAVYAFVETLKQLAQVTDPALPVQIG
ncbi:MAG: LysR family transcriptional regulator [Leptolyngbyaceae bacterium]|nr:LysR family transcriptional regulator [Leptolyngbyaceae bacterium]